MRRPTNVVELTFDQEVDLALHYLWLTRLRLLTKRRVWADIDEMLFNSSKIAYKYLKGEIYATDTSVWRVEKKLRESQRFREHPTLEVLRSDVCSVSDVAYFIARMSKPIPERLLRARPDAKSGYRRDINVGWRDVREEALALDSLDCLGVVLALLREKELGHDDLQSSLLAVDAYEVLLRVVKDPRYSEVERLIFYVVDKWITSMRPHCAGQLLDRRAYQLMTSFSELELYDPPRHSVDEKAPIFADITLDPNLSYALWLMWQQIGRSADQSQLRPRGLLAPPQRLRPNGLRNLLGIGNGG